MKNLDKKIGLKFSCRLWASLCLRCQCGMLFCAFFVSLLPQSLIHLFHIDSYANAQATRTPPARAARPAAQAATGSNPPSSLGSGSQRELVSSESAISVGQRTDNVTTKKKQTESLREKRESGGRRLNRSEIQRVVGEQKLSGALNKEISYAEGLLKKLPKNSPQRPRVLQRIIENYHQKSLLVFFAESRKYDIDWKKWDRAGRTGREPMLDTKRSTEWTSKVVQKAQQMISEYPKDQEIDEAYFQIAYALDTLGKRKDAASYYSQLVAKFPNSNRVPDSHFAVGEYYFDMTDFRKALTSFKESSKFTRAAIYPWSYFKMAWCYYNLKDYRNSLGAFQNVVRISDRAKSMTREGRQRLKEEALRDMVNPYAELQDINGAERYFSQVGGQKYFGDLLTRLANLLREQGQYEKSITVLRRFISRNPTELSAADIQIQIVDTANLMADKKTLWIELQNLLKNYSPSSLWGKRNEKNPEYKELAERVHNVSISYPKQMHADAQKLKSKYLYGQAALGYQLYLKHFSNREEAEEIRFLMGEIQYQQAMYPQARATFWEITAKEKKSKFFAKAAQYLLSSSYIPIEPGMKMLRNSGAKLAQSERPINLAVLEYLKVCGKIIEWFPTSKSVKDCELDAAEVYLKHNHYEKAEAELWKIAKKYPTGKEGRDAAELLLWLASKDSAKLVKTSDELSKIAEFKSGEVGKRLSAIDESNKFQKTLELEKSGSFIQAAENFEKLARSNPKGNEADKAWFNAGVNYRKGGDSIKAIGAFTRVYTDFPKTAQAPDALLQIIEIADSQLRLEEAAAHSIKFVEAYATDKRSAVVMREACILYKALNEVAGAQRTCGLIIKSGGRDVGLAAESLAHVYRRSGRYADLVTVTDMYLIKLPVSTSEKIVFLAEAAEAERKLGKRGNAASRENQIMALFARDRGKISGAALAVIGRIEFDRQAPVLQKYVSTKITARKPDGSDLQATITAKQALLVNLERSYKKVIDTGDSEWGVAALFTLGGAYEVFANDLKSAPMPPGVPESETKPLKANLAKLAEAPAGKAVAFYKQAADVVAKFGVYNDYSKRNSTALARTDPARHRDVDEWIPDTSYVGSRWSDVGPASRIFKYLGEN